MGESKKPASIGVNPSFLEVIDEHVNIYCYSSRSAFVLDAIRNQIHRDRSNRASIARPAVREAIITILSIGGLFSAKTVKLGLELAGIRVGKGTVHDLLNNNERIIRIVRKIGRRKRVYYEIK